MIYMNKTTKTVEIPFEMIDQIVIDSIKEAIEMNAEGNQDRPNLLSALAECLRYFEYIEDANRFLRKYDL